MSVFKIKRRWLLILSVEVAQLVCLLAALTWFGHWLAGGLDAALRDQLPFATGASSQHQREAAITASVHRALEIVRHVGTTLVAILFIFSASLTALIVRRYESRLDDANTRLSTLVARRSAALMKTRDAVIFGLARLAESRDDQTGEHLDRIGQYVRVLGHALMKHHPDLDDDAIATMALASSLHDIGKVGIPDAILLKPGPLTPQERLVMQRHPLIGGECLLAIKQRLGEDDFLTTACEIAFCHHERWDGTGYPFGLHGADIPLAGRIVALADVYDALTSRRAYKEAVPHALAVEIISKGAGTQFDPQVVQAFLECMEDFAEINTPAHAGSAHPGSVHAGSAHAAPRLAKVA